MGRAIVDARHGERERKDWSQSANGGLRVVDVLTQWSTVNDQCAERGNYKWVQRAIAVPAAAIGLPLTVVVRAVGVGVAAYRRRREQTPRLSCCSALDTTATYFDV